MHHRIFFRVRLFIALILGIFWGSDLFAQCYDFTNFSLKEGLSQSQVATIFQAKDRTLWLGTYGGVSNFDGKEFTSFSKADGLISNNVTSIVQDNQGKIIVGSDRGIDAIKEGKIQNILSGYSIYQLRKDKYGTIWGIIGKKLFKLANDKVVFVNIDDKYITNISGNKKGDLFVVASGKGIYQQTKDSWTYTIAFPEEIASNYVIDVIFDKDDSKKIYLATWNGGVYCYNGADFKTLFKNEQLHCFSIEQDEKSNIWVGLEHGAVILKKEETLYLKANNGLSDNRTYDIFRDAENNMWISTSTNGIYKYEGDNYIRYNRFKQQDLGYTVSGIAADQKDNLFVGTLNKGLLKYDGDRVEAIKNPAFLNKSIYFVYPDEEKNIWFSAHDSGVWKTDGKKFELVYPIEKYAYNSMLKIGEEAWLASFLSVTHIKNGKKTYINGFSGYESCLFNLGKDGILIGTTTGLYLVKDDKIDPKFAIPALKNSYVLCIIRRNETLIIGTLGDGVITYDLKTKTTKKYTTVDGLNSNDIYSLDFDNYGHLWVGTGRGVNTFNFNKAKKRYQALNTSSPIMECNQNAILNYKDFILIGTIDGLIQCKTKGIDEQTQSPLIQVNKINVFHKTDHFKDLSIMFGNQKNGKFELNHNQNNITINYKAVFLSHPQDISYRYMLRGIDADFGKSLKNTQVEYYSLRPGTYTFLVYATANGQKSNISQFTFTIVPPFYETLWFIILMVWVVLTIICVVFYLFFKTKERKKLELERIKQVEQSKIRKQTSEDFHDDIGNKLTRINVLSEILDKKMNTDQVEQKQLIKLIQENAGLLYTGTKDILWALNPQSGNLFEILTYVRDFGIDLFQNTGVKFEMDGILSEHRKINLPMEFNRNFTLIFKEILNNVLKHAEAKEVLVMVIKTSQDTIDIITVDNGVGFEIDKIIKGGLNNIQNRCKRIKSTLEVNSTIGKGTTLIISTKIAVTN
jgi:signal transduction histidine kinase/ligand-binding sensor domain-containing protein